MSAKRLETPEPICEKCWLSEHTHWEPESMDDNGDILMRLRGVDVPIKYNTGHVETCYECGEITISGIFDRKTGSNHVFKSAGTIESELAQEGPDEDYE